MSPHSFGFLAALATVACWVAVLVWVVLAATRSNVRVRSVYRRYDDALRRFGLHFAAVIAAGGLLGSLYFSEVARYTPCFLCWMQRIALFPLAVLLFIAIGVGDRSVRRYVIPLAAIGAVFSIWNLGVEWLPGMIGSACTATTPCSTQWVKALGFVTLPVMALTAAAVIAFFTWAAGRPAPDDSPRS